MSDHTDSIQALQRAARTAGRREASARIRDARERRSSWLRVKDVRDAVHFRALRASELIAAMPSRHRRIAVGAGGVTVLLVAVLTATAGAGAGGDQPASRASAHSAPTSDLARGPRGSRRNETLVGSSRADHINGRAGDDVVLAGAGDDLVAGATGNDVIHGGAGDDRLYAGPGRDVLIGSTGDDQLRATDLDGQRDRLHCGPGNDVAWVVARNGRIEDVTTGCERVNVIDVRATRRAR